MSPLQVVSVDADVLLLEAFLLMRRHRVGGVPAVTPAGGDYESERTSGGGGAAGGVAGRRGRRLELFANISVRDIQLLMLQPELFDDCRYESAPSLQMCNVNWHVCTMFVHLVNYLTPSSPPCLLHVQEPHRPPIC